MNCHTNIYKYLQKEKENAELTINNLPKTVQERDKEIDSLVEKLKKWELATDVYIYTSIDTN